MAPETAMTTRFHLFIFIRIRSFAFRLIRPVVHKAALLIGKKDVAHDAAWIVNVADTPLSLDGMRLGKFDKPAIRNRRLLQSLYWGNSEVRPEGSVRTQGRQA
jgi:hypothetical protein